MSGIAGLFGNSYFKEMLTHGWGPVKNVSGEPGNNQWERID